MAPAKCTPTGVQFPLQLGWLVGRHGPSEVHANWRAIPAPARLAGWPPWPQRSARQLACNSRSSSAGWLAAMAPANCTPTGVQFPLQLGWLVGRHGPSELHANWRAIPAPARLAGWPPW